MRPDARGLAMTTDSAAAAVAFDTAVHRSLEYRLDTMDHVTAVLEADPDFVLGQALKGFLMLGMQSQAVLPDVLAICDWCEARTGGLTAREQGWVAALRPLALNNKKQALAVFDQEHDHARRRRPRAHRLEPQYAGLWLRPGYAGLWL